MIVLLILSLVLIGGTISYGVVGVTNETFNSKKFKKVLKVNLGAILPIVLGFIVLAVPGAVNAAETAAVTETAANSAAGWKYMAAALSTGLAAIAAGYSVAVAASSAIGAVSEDPKLMGKTLIYVGLAEGIALYGMIVSFMILLVG